MRRAGRLAGIVSILVVACPLKVAAAETPFYKELVKKAQAEGQVEYWTSMDEGSANKILKEFSRKFGIKSKAKLWRGPAIHQRTLIEIQSGRKVSADVMDPGRESRQQFLEAGVFEKPPFDYYKVWPDIPKVLNDPSGWALNVNGSSRAIAYNSRTVPPELVPKSWDDCTRPEFKGKVTLDARHKLYPLHWHRREWFLDWVKRMVANGVKVFRGQTEMLQFVVGGAYVMLCGAQPYTVQDLIDQGAKELKIAVPGELLVEIADADFIRKGSPHPHAGQLLVGWLATEGQPYLDKEELRGFPWVKGTFNAKLAEGHKVLLCDPECTLKADEMSREYVRALGLPVTK